MSMRPGFAVLNDVQYEREPTHSESHGGLTASLTDRRCSQCGVGEGSIVVDRCVSTIVVDGSIAR